jgi:serine/threonine protein kinase
MNPNRAELLFQRALEKPAEKRAAFLDVMCEGNPAVRQRLDALLAAHEQPETLLATQAEAVRLREDASTFAKASEGTSARQARPTIKLDLPDAPDEAVGQMLGRYKLLERVGEGGCGVVYVAEQTEPVRRRVALKVIKLGMDTKQVVARFEAERQALAMMDHPNIAKVLDAGTTDVGRPYFVMELVRGIKITDYCDQANLTTKERLDLFIKVCQAIQHAHQKGIIHRDIKPSNILVTLHDGLPVPKVIDFGIAKATEGRLTDNTIYTQLHQFIGTPAYMSPEQAEMSGLDIDTRSDIYSLGVLLYELLAGSTPFDTKELMAYGIDAMRKTIREKEPVRPSTKLSQILVGADVRRLKSPAPDQPSSEEEIRASSRRLLRIKETITLLKGDLDWIVMKCLEKDRTRRYETANGLAMDLKRHLTNEPVLARPPSSVYRLQMAFRRNKLVFTAGASVMLALLLGLGISIWQYLGKSRAEREQIQLRERAEAKAIEASEARALAAQQRDLVRESLYESLLRESRSIRKSRQLGYRSEVFDRLKQAIAVGTAHIDTSMLRREAAASFGDWIGLTPVDIAIPSGIWFAALTPDGTLAALALADTSLVSLRETRTGREVAAIDVGGDAISLAFDPKGFALFVVASESKIDFGQRPKPLHLEKWSQRSDGSWRREWSRPADGVTLALPAADAVIGLTLGPDDSYPAVQNLEKNEEIARVPVTNLLPWFPIADISADLRQIAFFSRENTNAFDWQLEVWDLTARKKVAFVNAQLGRGSGLSLVRMESIWRPSDLACGSGICRS